MPETDWLRLAPWLIGLVAAPFAAADGALLVVGGGIDKDNAAIYRRVVSERLGSAPICVIPAATTEPEESAAYSVERFNHFGGAGSARAIRLSTKNPELADDPGLAEELSKCGGIFFTGGDQALILQVLRPDGRESLALKAIRELYARGGDVAGTSAGAAALSDPMIGSGDSAGAMQFGVVGTVDAPGVFVTHGLGLTRSILTDQHHLARGRLGRTVVALAQATTLKLALGVDEDTAAVIKGETIEVIGASNAVLIDARHATRFPGGVGLKGAELWFIGPGDSFDLASDTPIPGAGKIPLGMDAPRPSIPKDVWDGDGFPHLIDALARSTAQELKIPGIGSMLVLRELEGFRALGERRAFKRRGPRGLPLGFFAGPFSVDLVVGPSGS